jgi:O-antigen ligase
MIALILLCGLIWLLILLHQIAHRGFLVLIIWLLVAPVMSNFVNNPGGNPIFNLEEAQKARDDVQEREAAAFVRPEDNPIRLNQLLEPTRNIVGLFLVIFILKALLKKKRLGPFDAAEVWMGIFSCILLAGVLLLSSRLHFSLRMASDAFIVPFFAYYITRRLVTNEVRFQQFSRIMIYAGFCLMIIQLIVQLVQQVSLYRLTGIFKSSVPLFMITMVTFYTALLYTICHNNLSIRRLYIGPGIRYIVLILCPVVVFFTFSRGNWLGFLTGIWVFLFMARRKIGFLQKLRILGVAFTIIPPIVIFLAIFTPVENINTEIGNTYTIYGRIVTWLIAIQTGAEHPLIGIGLNNLRYVLYETRTLFNGARNFTSAHNSFLAIFAEQGIVGLLVYLALLASIIRKGLNLYRAGTHFQDQWRGITLVAVVTSYHIPALFASVLHDHIILTHFYVYVFAGAIAGLYTQRRSIPNIPIALKQDQWISKETPVHV